MGHYDFLLDIYLHRYIKLFYLNVNLIDFYLSLYRQFTTISKCVLQWSHSKLQ